MSIISRDEVRRVARLANLERPREAQADGTFAEPKASLLDDATLDRLARDINRILEHVNELMEVDVDGVPPTSHGVPLPTLFREDAPDEDFDRGRALDAAPARTGDAIRVPKIVE